MEKLTIYYHTSTHWDREWYLPFQGFRYNLVKMIDGMLETTSKERAEFMNVVAQNHFLPGMPTVAYDNHCHSTDYWRGPCWLNVAYFAAKGLKNHGFTETAETVKNTILEWIYNDGDTIHESYNSKTGKGQNNSNFSWSCVFAREFIKNI